MDTAYLQAQSPAGPLIVQSSAVTLGVVVGSLRRRSTGRHRQSTGRRSDHRHLGHTTSRRPAAGRQASGRWKGVRGLCLEPHALAIARYAAAREKDLIFTRELVRRGIVAEERLLLLLERTQVDEEVRNRIGIGSWLIAR
ncbi:MAG: hypothetical protein JO274_01820 [Gammaproteobacteria bacterium]|nr:hypothetical protein [Gammaproteobacteria bacterium]